jgi:hypothetical protein
MMRVMSATKPYLGRTGISATAWILRVVAAVALAVAAVLPINQLTQPGGSVAVAPGSEEAERILDLPGLPDGVTVVDADPAALLLASDLPAPLRALTELPAVLAAVGIAAGAWWLAQVLTTIRAGRPFDARNPARLAGVAAAVLLAGLVAPMSEGLVGAVVLDHLELTGPDFPFALFSIPIPLTPIALALVTLAAAEAFRRGGALADEVEGMV